MSPRKNMLSNLSDPKERQIIEHIFRACVKSSVWDYTSGFRGTDFFDLDELSMGAQPTKEGKVTYDKERAIHASTDLIDLFSQKIKEQLTEYSVERLAFIENPVGPVGMIPYKNHLTEATRINSCIIRPRRRVLHAAVKGAPVRTGEIFAVISDVATTGISIYAASRILIRLGGKVPVAFVVFDREQGARENLHAVGIDLVSLVNRSGAAKGGFIPDSPPIEPKFEFLGQLNISSSS